VQKPPPKIKVIRSESPGLGVAFPFYHAQGCTSLHKHAYSAIFAAWLSLERFYRSSFPQTGLCQ
jgi:hypothetical protein